MLKRSLYILSISILRNTVQRSGQIATIKTSLTRKERTEATSHETLNLDSQLPSYTQEERDTILQILNNIDPKALFNYDISKDRASKLLAWKARHGDLKHIQDILLVEGFGIKAVKKLYKSLLSEATVESTASKTVRPRTAPFVIPVLDPEQRYFTHSCVSVHIGICSVTWARLELPSSATVNSPCILTHWQNQSIGDKKLHLLDLVQRCHYVHHLIPEADCYVLENPQTAQVNKNPSNAEQQNINVQKAQVAATLSYALNARCKQGLLPATIASDKKLAVPQNIFFLRRFLAARLFNNIVGTERVSSENIVLRLMRTYYNIEEDASFLEEQLPALAETEPDVEETKPNTIRRLSFRRDVQFPSKQRNIFSQADRVQREFLGQALLLNLAFVRLVLLQDEESIGLVTRNSRKNK